MARRRSAVLCLLLLALLGRAAPAAEKDGKPDKELAAKLRKLLPAAAAMDAKTMAGLISKRITGPGGVKDWRLTTLVVGSKYLLGFPRDVNIVPKTTPKQLGAAMGWNGTMTMLRADHITKVACRRLKGGKRARGEVSVKSAIHSATFPFEAELVGGKWRISAFDLPATARRVALGRDGKWKLTTLPTRDPMILFPRRMRDNMKKVVMLPVAMKSQRMTSKALAPYGELRFNGVKPLKFADKGKGVFLYYAADTKFSEVAAAAKDPKSGKYRPLAVLTGDYRGTSVMGFLPLPEIVPKVRPAKEGEIDPIVMKIGVGTKKTFLFTIRQFRTADPDKMIMKLLQLRSVTEEPIWLAPDKDAPLRALVAAVDCCLRAKFPLKDITIDPGKPPAKKK